MDRAAIEQLPMPSTYALLLARSFDPEALFQGCGIRTEDLDDSSLRVTVRQTLRYVENANTLADQPDWHLPWTINKAGHFNGPITLALSSAPTLGDSIDAFTRYFPSRVPYMHLDTRQVDGKIFVELVPLISLGPATPVLIETILLSLMQHVETVYDVNVAEAALELAYPPTPYADRYGAYFHCEVRFDARRNALSIPVAWRTCINLSYIESSWAHAVSQCEAMMGSSRERETLREIRMLLCRAFEREERKRPLPTLSEVADTLHITRRTLIRRLRRLGTTYQQIIDDFLLARAQEMLENDELTIKQVATALGFDDPANFGKAFKRWCGVPPGSYRKGQLHADHA